MNHPTPWRVAYDPSYREWHRQSRPHVVDANGKFIVRPDQTPGVHHPGHYDQVAEETCHRIVNAVNVTENKPLFPAYVMPRNSDLDGRF